VLQAVMPQSARFSGAGHVQWSFATSPRCAHSSAGRDLQKSPREGGAQFSIQRMRRSRECHAAFIRVSLGRENLWVC